MHRTTHRYSSHNGNQWLERFQCDLLCEFRELRRAYADEDYVRGIHDLLVRGHHGASQIFGKRISFVLIPRREKDLRDSAVAMTQSPNHLFGEIPHAEHAELDHGFATP
jgi:hypothetical protein